jgi:hypothetical protein
MEPDFCTGTCLHNTVSVSCQRTIFCCNLSLTALSPLLLPSGTVLCNVRSPAKVTLASTGRSRSGHLPYMQLVWQPELRTHQFVCTANCRQGLTATPRLAQDSPWRPQLPLPVICTDSFLYVCETIPPQALCQLSLYPRHQRRPVIRQRSVYLHQRGAYHDNATLVNVCHALTQRIVGESSWLRSTAPRACQNATVATVLCCAVLCCADSVITTVMML